MTAPRFGIEIEFIHSDASQYDADLDEYTYGDYADELSEGADVDVVYEDYNHGVRSHWKLTTDSSCGLELVSPPLTWPMRTLIRPVVNALRHSGAVLNQDCGFHVHHEWPWYGSESPDMEVRLQRIRGLYRMIERPILRDLFPPSRWENRFCRYTTAEEGYLFDDRYVDVNFCALGRQSTVEFRQHQGTMNYTKIVAWVELTRMLTHAASVSGDYTDRQRLFSVFEKLTTTTHNHLTARCPQYPAFLAALQDHACLVH